MDCLIIKVSWFIKHLVHKNFLFLTLDYKEVLKQAEKYCKEQLDAGKVPQEFVDKMHEKLGGLGQKNQQTQYAQAYPSSNGVQSGASNYFFQASYPVPIYNVQQCLQSVVQYLYTYPYGISPSIIQYLIDLYERALFLYQLSQNYQHQGQVVFGGPVFNPFYGNPFYGSPIYGPPIYGPSIYG